MCRCLDLFQPVGEAYVWVEAMVGKLSDGEYGCQGSIGDEDQKYQGQVEHGIFVEVERVFAAYFLVLSDLAIELDHFS